MVQSLPGGYHFDPADPRAPTVEQWAEMTPAERAAIVAMLPAEVPFDLLPSEGDRHRKAKREALDALDSFFRRAGRKIYLSSEIAVFYPDEPRFAPDVLAVTDVETHERDKWVVADEGKGLDFVMEVHVAGDRKKDEQRNVERYARLGIQEYVYFDRGRLRLAVYRLSAGGRVYQRVVPQAGRFSSQVLGLDLGLEGSRLRFFAGNAPLEDADEMISRIGSMLDEVIAKQEEAEHAAEELASKLAESERLRSEAERQLAEARAEIERLKAR